MAESKNFEESANFPHSSDSNVGDGTSHYRVDEKRKQHSRDLEKSNRRNSIDSSRKYDRKREDRQRSGSDKYSYRRKSLSPSPERRYRKSRHHSRHRSRSKSPSRRRRGSRSRSVSPPRRGRGRGPFTPTVGQIPKQPKALVRDSFTAPAISSLTGISQMEANAMEWIGADSFSMPLSSFPTQIPGMQEQPNFQQMVTLSSNPSSEGIAAAKAAASKLAAKLPTQTVQPSIDTGKLTALDEKKKLLWSKKKEESGGDTQWDHANFGDESDAKFRRLMGISGESSKVTKDVKPALLSHEKTQEDLERQYELSRFQTHMGKGLGLGYPKLSSTSEENNT